jgi:hypothetical protein
MLSSSSVEFSSLRFIFRINADLINAIRLKSTKSMTVAASVAEPVHFCAAPAPARQKFGYGLDHFPYIIEKNSTIFMVFEKFSCFLKT